MSLNFIDGKELLLYAVDHTPSLIIDCANWANPHSLFGRVELDQLEQVYVVEVELLYKFRDILKKADELAEEVGAGTIVITPFNYLFNYQNEKENKKIIIHCLQIIKKLSDKYDVALDGNIKITSKESDNYRKARIAKPE